MNSKELVLREMFGKNETYVGFDNIVASLILKGNCITTTTVSGKFIGGIWNFIKERKNPIPEGVELIEFVLDKETVYNSELFKEYKNRMLKKKKEKLERLTFEVERLQKFISDLS